MPASPVAIRPVLWFLVLTFALNWGLVGLFLAAGGAWNTPAALVVSLSYMLVPALVALGVQRWVVKAPIRELGLVWRWNRAVVASWLLPVGLAIAALGVALLLPGVVYSPGMEGMFARFEGSVTPEQAAEMRRQAAALPFHPFFLALIQGLFAGLTVNAVFALGEELGWRGFLHKALSPLGFWKSAGLIGVIWGIWHAPLILQGHNYPQHPVAGVFLMVLFTLGISPLIQHLRERAETVFAAAIFHGTLNASYGLSIMLIAGGNDLLIGMSGLAGLVTLALANVGLFAWRRRQA